MPSRWLVVSNPILAFAVFTLAAPIAVAAQESGNKTDTSAKPHLPTPIKPTTRKWMEVQGYNQKVMTPIEAPQPKSTIPASDTRASVTGSVWNGGSSVGTASGGGFGSIPRSWVDTNSKVPDLNAQANAVAIQHIKLEAEGFAIDTSPSDSTWKRKGKP